ncbi:MAG: DUF1853 family protein [Arenibacter sp.]|nr:DUF1853 family protein [Arenibacter sp.]
MKTLSIYDAFQKTPPLWYDNYEGLEQFVFPGINLQDFSPLPIPKQLRLGHQLEFVFHQLLLHNRRYKVLATNVPVRKNKITLGEFDFILRDLITGKPIHLELTYKFYIVTGVQNTPMEEQLLGPNFRDTYMQKKERIISHQLPLSSHKEGRNTLKEYGIATKDLSKLVCFKSQLFTPYYSTKMDVTPFNSDCIRGSWISNMDFEREEFTSYQYYLPTKLEWLLLPYNEVEWCSYKDILDSILPRLENNSAPLLWVKKSAMELSKIFILWRTP